MVQQANVTIDNVEARIMEYFPDCWLPLKACLSTIAARQLEDLNHCVGMILVGQPGGRKTTTINMLGRFDPIYALDSFTPRCFVSHVQGRSEEELQDIDILPQLKGKILVVPEMGTLFSQRQEELDSNIGMMTRIMDGNGYMSSSGVHGRRGYEGDYRFNMIGATTPLQHRAWVALGKLSSRWVFYHLDDIGEGSIEEDIRMMRSNYELKLIMCQVLVKVYMNNFWQGFNSVSWNREQDDKDCLEKIASSARELCSWRGLVLNEDPEIVEVPHRLRETLYALARGHALLHERTQINSDDVSFVRYLNETNMPQDRLGIYRVLPRDGTGITVNKIRERTGFSNDKTDRLLNELKALDVVSYDTKHGRYCRS